MNARPRQVGVSIRRGPSIVAAFVAAVLLLATGCSSPSAPGQSSPPLPSAGQTTPSPSDTTTALATEGPRAPATGAWVGAWVRPAAGADDQSGRVAAVAAFEQSIGRPLDVVHVFHKWADDFPSSADLQFVQSGKVLLISWAGTDLKTILSGSQDAIIKARADQVKALQTPVLLRWRWEMNRPNLQASIGTPADYVAAWKHIRAIFTTVGATNVGWVWCPLASGFTATNAPAYYPGDDQVDWLCTDVYGGPTNISFASVATDFTTWAAAHQKPIIIGEYGARSTDPDKAGWIRGATAFAVAHPQIKAMVYFNASRVENGTNRDFRVESAPAPLQAFKAMASEPYFNQRRGL